MKDRSPKIPQSENNNDVSLAVAIEKKDKIISQRDSLILTLYEAIAKGQRDNNLMLNEKNKVIEEKESQYEAVKKTSSENVKLTKSITIRNY